MRGVSQQDHILPVEGREQIEVPGAPDICFAEIGRSQDLSGDLGESTKHTVTKGPYLLRPVLGGVTDGRIVLHEPDELVHAGGYHPESQSAVYFLELQKSIR